jgi:diguanylate cyclase (GGDEF)-like protein
VLVARALSFHRRMQAASRDLERLASLDPLTGLLNARAFRAQGEACIASMRRSGLPCAVLFIDLDHFKSINDRHGHAAGDEVLRAVAELLQARLRRSDLLGRIGGEEFAVVLPDTDAGGRCSWPKRSDRRCRPCSRSSRVAHASRSPPRSAWKRPPRTPAPSPS